MFKTDPRERIIWLPQLQFKLKEFIKCGLVPRKFNAALILYKNILETKICCYVNVIY